MAWEAGVRRRCHVFYIPCFGASAKWDTFPPNYWFGRQWRCTLLSLAFPHRRGENADLGTLGVWPRWLTIRAPCLSWMPSSGIPEANNSWYHLRNFVPRRGGTLYFKPFSHEHKSCRLPYCVCRDICLSEGAFMMHQKKCSWRPCCYYNYGRESGLTRKFRNAPPVLLNWSPSTSKAQSTTCSLISFPGHALFPINSRRALPLRPWFPTTQLAIMMTKLSLGLIILCFFGSWIEYDKKNNKESITNTLIIIGTNKNYNTLQVATYCTMNTIRTWYTILYKIIYNSNIMILKLTSHPSD